MPDEFSDIAFRGISRLENELLVRDFLEVVSYGDVTAFGPFLHREIEYRVGSEPAVLGSRAVLRFCEQFALAFPDFEVRIETMSSVDQTVIVEESVVAATPGGCKGHPIAAFASFRILDYQIVSWHQVYG